MAGMGAALGPKILDDGQRTINETVDDEASLSSILTRGKFSLDRLCLGDQILEFSIEKRHF